MTGGAAAVVAMRSGAGNPHSNPADAAGLDYAPAGQSIRKGMRGITRWVGVPILAAGVRDLL